MSPMSGSSHIITSDPSPVSAKSLSSVQEVVKDTWSHCVEFCTTCVGTCVTTCVCKHGFFSGKIA